MLHPDLFVVITMNPVELGVEGVRPLSQPLRSRFRGLVLAYPPLEQEVKIVKKQLKMVATARKMLKVVYWMLKEGEEYRL